MTVTDIATHRQNLVREQLSATEDWQTTQEIARALGVEWEPGGHGDLDAVRDDLYRLWLKGVAEHEPRHNGHHWRLA